MARYELLLPAGAAGVVEVEVVAEKNISYDNPSITDSTVPGTFRLGGGGVGFIPGGGGILLPVPL